LSAVLAEQVRFLGLAMRRDAMAGAGLILLALVLRAFLGDAPVNFTREIGLSFAALGFVAALGVWKRLAADGDLWTLPVDHRRTTIVGVAAGWFWLQAAACALLAGMVALISVTGGQFASSATRVVLSSSAAVTGAIDPRHLTTIAWSSPHWLWAVPFTAATVAYLLGSAIVIATRHPWRWLAGFGLVALLLLLFGGDAGPGWSYGGLRIVAAHPYGLETVFAGGPVSRTTRLVTLTTGQTILVWRDLPALGRWVTATVLWSALGLAGLWLATIRLRERERPRERLTTA
jgi:hypothetical protein